MKSNLILKKSIELEASNSEVWKSLTDPETLKKTMFGCDVITDWEKGSQILFKGNWNGNEFVDKGTILNFQNGKSFAYNYWSNFSGLPDNPENYSIIRFEIEESQDRTILKLEHSNFATETMYEHSDKNWEEALNAFKELIEK